MKNPIVLAYSGSDASDAALAWLTASFGAEVVALVLDVGAGMDVEGLRTRALAGGARRAHAIDARDELARGYVLPLLQAGARFEGGTPVVRGLVAPLVAEKLVEVARIEDASAVAHAGAGEAIDRAVAALDPRLPVMRLDRAATGGDARPRAERAGHDASAARDAHIWGRATYRAARHDSWQAVASALTAPAGAPVRPAEAPAVVELTFDAGVPVAVNGVTMGLTELIESLSVIAGAHAIGCTEQVTGSGVDLHEAPAAAVLHAAHDALYALVADAGLQQLARDLGRRYALLVRDGLWHAPQRRALAGFAAALQPAISGEARLALFQGRLSVIDCRLAEAAAADGRPAQPLTLVVTHA